MTQLKSKSIKSTPSTSGFKALLKKESRIEALKKVDKTDSKIKNNTNVKNTKKITKRTGLGDIDWGGIASTAGSVVSTIGKLASGDVAEVLNVPNTLMKVVNTTSNIVSDLKKSDVPVPEKIITLSPDADLSKSNNNAIMSEVKKFIPVVNMSSIPSSYANNVTLPPIVRQDGMLKNGQKFTNVTGSNLGGTVTYNAVGSFVVTTAIRIHPNIGSNLLGTRLQTISQTFQKWRLNKLIIQYVPVQSTSEPGQIYLTVKQGTDTTAPTSASQMSQNELFSTTTAYTSGSLLVPGYNAWYYTATDATTDFKFFTTWSVFVAADFNDMATVTTAGKLLYHYDIDFLAPVGAPNTNFFNMISEKLSCSRLMFAPENLSYRNFIRLSIKVCKDVISEIESLSSSEGYDPSSLTMKSLVAYKLRHDVDNKEFLRKNHSTISEFTDLIMDSFVNYQRFEVAKAYIRFGFKPLYRRLFEEILIMIGPMMSFMFTSDTDNEAIESLNIVRKILVFILNKYDESIEDIYELSDEEGPDASDR